MEKRYILFDMDGTITDSYEGIINALVYSLKEMGIEPDPDRYREAIGPPLKHTYMGVYGMSAEESERAIKIYRRYYDEKGYAENKLYDGVADMLHTLHAHDKKLMIATSKDEVIAEKIVTHFGLSSYFYFVAGTNDDGLRNDRAPSIRSSKEDVIRYILSSNDIKDPEKTVMVGDRAYDMIAAKNLGLQTIGVLYGFGSGEELLSAGADHLAKYPHDIERYIIES